MTDTPLPPDPWSPDHDGWWSAPSPRDAAAEGPAPDWASAAPGSWVLAPPPPPAPQGSLPPPAGSPPPPPAAWGWPPVDGWGQPATPPKRGGPARIAALVLAAALLGFTISGAFHRIQTSLSSSGRDTAPFAQAISPSPDAAGVAAKVDPGVVDINTKLGYQQGEAAGTGMVLTAGGEVLTNNHVVDGATSITATAVDTGRTYTAKVLGTDPSEDVALLQLEGASGLKTISAGDSSKVKVGQAVIAIGNAGGVGGAPSVVTGTVEATGQSITASDNNGADAEQLSNLIQTNAPIQPGDSGGPLADTAGKVIGIDTAGSTTGRFRFRQATANQAFAIPINQALSIAHQIERGVSTSTVHVGSSGFLGIEVDGSQSGSATQGAPVAGVVAGAPAAKSGLVAGDVITSLDGTAIDSPTALTTALRNHHPGDKVSVRWVTQAGQDRTATITLTTGPAD